MEYKNTSIDNEAIIKTIDRETNLIYKLLPQREEGLDWQTPLQNLSLEIAGLGRILRDHTDLFILLCKLEGLQTLTKKEDFLLFRKGIFECLNILNKVKQECQA